MNIFIPHNIQSRKEKLKQANLKMLQNEVLDLHDMGLLCIDHTFNFTADQVKVKIIKADCVYSIKNLGYIPQWLKNVKIIGSFNINGCNLTSLENCPEYIENNFYCECNPITDYSCGPKYVGRYYYASIKSTSKTLEKDKLQLRKQINKTTNIKQQLHICVWGNHNLRF